MTRYIAVIGTAGRDRSPLLTKGLWATMRRHLASCITVNDVLVSGGAAWADHLAVDAFLAGRCGGLELYLPAPLASFGEGATTKYRFTGPARSAGVIANYYHWRFSLVRGVDGIAEIALALEKGATAVYEPEAQGYNAFFRRNMKVASRCEAAIAYTFSEGDEPDDGGTLDTWSQIEGRKTHVSLTALMREDYL